MSRTWEFYKQRSKERTAARNRMMAGQKMELNETKMQLEEARKEIKNLNSSNLEIETDGTSQGPVRAFGEPPVILKSLRVQQLEMNEFKVQLEEARTQIKKLKNTNLVIMAESVKRRTDADEEIENLRWENEELRELCKKLEHSSIESDTKLVEKEEQAFEKVASCEEQMSEVESLQKFIESSKLEIERTLRKRIELKDNYDAQFENIESLKRENNLRLIRFIKGKTGKELDDQLKLYESQKSALQLLQCQVEKENSSKMDSVMGEFTDYLLSMQKKIEEFNLTDIAPKFKTSQVADTTPDVGQRPTTPMNQKICHNGCEQYSEGDTMQTFQDRIEDRLLENNHRNNWLSLFFILSVFIYYICLYRVSMNE